MKWKFWGKKKKAYTTVPLYLEKSENKIDLNALSKEEFDYLVTRFSETLKSLIYMTIEGQVRAGLERYKAAIIEGTDSISIQHTWGVLGNDLLVWLGEFRRKQEEGQLRL